MTAIQKRYDFVVLFDVLDGNPNGDPDAGNAPRIDPETGDGLVTDVCLKRKIRNYVTLTKQSQPPYEIYVKDRGVLNAEHRRAYEALGLKPNEGDDKGKKQDRGEVDKARAWMCQNYFDVRTFGAVMGTGVNCGQVRGPVQLTFARSIDPIVMQEHSITRVAITREEDRDKKETEMGRKMTIPYALYRGHGFISPQLAAQTGFSDEDLRVLWDAVAKMFELDRSSSRGQMSLRRLIVFEHDNPLGSAPAHRLFDSVQVRRKDAAKPARAFADYDVSIGPALAGVKVLEPLG
jgi:CRISPR-associated protein Csd2